jgi:MgtC family
VVVWHFLSTASIVPPDRQGLKQLGELALAFVLSSLIGIEREWRQKSAGLRTHALVGTGAALFVIVRKYGFTDVLGPHVILDPSRVAAQIVSGIGFIGGGLIFVHGDAVRGLTTAAIVWITAAIGMACGAGLAILALTSGSPSPGSRPSSLNMRFAAFPPSRSHLNCKDSRPSSSSPLASTNSPESSRSPAATSIHRPTDRRLIHRCAGGSLRGL